MREFSKMQVYEEDLRLLRKSCKIVTNFVLVLHLLHRVELSLFYKYIELKMFCVDGEKTGFHLTMHCYLCSVLFGDLVLKEHKASKWLEIDELGSVDWLPADVEVVKELKRSMLEKKL